MMKKGIFYVLLSAVLFSSMEVAVKLSGGVFNSIQLNFLRFLIGGLVLLPLARTQLRRANYKLTRDDWTGFLITGFICIVVSMTMYILSISFMPASIAAVFFSCNPFFAILLAAGMLNEKITRQVAAALVICLAGVVVIINPLHFEGSLIGVVIGLAAAAIFGLYSVLGKSLSMGRPTSGNVMTCYSFLLGSLELAVLMAMTHIPPVAAMFNSLSLPVFSNIPFFAGISWSTLPLLFLITVLVTGVGFACYFLAATDVSVTFASLVFFIKPVLAPLIALAVLNEQLTMNQWIGIGLIVLGSLVILLQNVREKGLVQRRISL